MFVTESARHDVHRGPRCTAHVEKVRVARELFEMRRTRRTHIAAQAARFNNRDEISEADIGARALQRDTGDDCIEVGDEDLLELS